MIHRKILVALDRSKEAGKVLQTALDLIREKGSKIKLLHCINSNFTVNNIPSICTIGDIDIDGNLHKKYHQELKQKIKQASDWSEYCCEQARMRKIPATFTCEIGDPGKKICEFAQSWSADLIILGCRGHNAIAEIFLGSVSNYVIHHACCSVLVVR